MLAGRRPHPEPGSGTVTADTPPEAVVGSLDMTAPEDRAALRSSIAKRWPVTPQMQEDFLRALNVALRIAIEARNARDINNCVRTMGMLVGQNQADEHLVFKAAVPEQHEHQHRYFVVEGIDESKL